MMMILLHLVLPFAHGRRSATISLPTLPASRLRFKLEMKFHGPFFPLKCTRVLNHISVSRCNPCKICNGEDHGWPFSFLLPNSRPSSQTAALVMGNRVRRASGTHWTSESHGLLYLECRRCHECKACLYIVRRAQVDNPD